MSAWALELAPPEGIAGFVRLELRPDDRVAWYWAYFVRVPGHDGVISVRDVEVALPRQRLEIRADGLWAEMTCETPREHWTFGMEAFGVRLDAADDALHGEIGERVPVGLDLEWEVAEGGPPLGTVHGELLVARDRYAIEMPGWFVEPDVLAPARPPVEAGGSQLARVLVPLPGGVHLEYVLRTTERETRWTKRVVVP